MILPKTDTPKGQPYSCPFFHSRQEALGNADQWLPCAYGLFAGLRQDAGQFPPQCLERFSAWREGTQGRRPVASVCVWTFHRASARYRPILAAMPPGDSRSAVPFCMGCPPHTGARRKKIPYPVSFGIRHFEKGVNEQGISPASRSVPVRTGIHSLPLPGSPEWAVPIWRTCCRGYWQGPANQR